MFVIILVKQTVSRCVEACHAGLTLLLLLPPLLVQDVERICGIPADTVASEEYTTQEDSIQKCLQDHR